MKENVDYRLLPDPDDDLQWNVRILTGPYLDTLYQYDTLKITDDGEHLSFSVRILETPDTELTTDDIDFQQYCGKILTNVLEESIKEKE